MDFKRYEFHRMTTPDVEEVKEFISNNFPRDSYYNFPGWFEWQYIENPNGCHIEICRHKNVIVGIQGVLPANVRLNDEIFTAGFAVNTMVVKSHRRKGIAGHLHQQRLDTYDFALSSGQSIPNLRLYLKRGWEIFDTFQSVMLCGRFPSISASKQSLRELVSWSKGRLNLINKNDEIECESGDISEMSLNDFKDLYPTHSFYPVKTEDNSLWRFKRHPYFNYHLMRFSLKDIVIGLVIYRCVENMIIVVDVLSSVQNRTQIIRKFGRVFKSKLIVGTFSGAKILEFFHKARFHIYKNAWLLGKSKDRSLNKLGSEMEWCFSGADSDKDR